MSDVFEIELPKDVSAAELHALRGDLRTIQEVEDTGSGDERAIDPASVMLWVQVITGALTAVGTGAAVLEKIVGVLRGRGIKGAKIKLADGTTIDAEQISPEALATVLGKDAK